MALSEDSSNSYQHSYLFEFGPTDENSKSADDAVFIQPNNVPPANLEPLRNCEEKGHLGTPEGDETVPTDTTPPSEDNEMTDNQIIQRRQGLKITTPTLATPRRINNMDRTARTKVWYRYL